MAASVAKDAAILNEALFIPPELVTGIVPLGEYVGPELTLQLLAAGAPGLPDIGVAPSPTAGTPPSPSPSTVVSSSPPMPVGFLVDSGSET